MQFFYSFKRKQIDMSTADELAATFRTNAQSRSRDFPQSREVEMTVFDGL